MMRRQGCAIGARPIASSIATVIDYARDEVRCTGHPPVPGDALPGPAVSVDLGGAPRPPRGERLRLALRSSGRCS